MIQGLCRWILYKRCGFRFVETVERPQKYIIALAPHTSNWDFVIGILFSRAEGFKCHFMMKQFWFFWPLGYLMKALGGVPVKRERHTSMTDAIAETARKSKEFHLCITPEGTRSRQPEWRRGFYYIALKAELPILLYGLDYKRRLIQCTKQVIPTGDYEREIVEIKQYYEGFSGKYPEKFTTGLDN